MLSFSLQIAFWHLHLQKDSVVKSDCGESIQRFTGGQDLWSSFLWNEEIHEGMRNTVIEVILLGRGRHGPCLSKYNWSSDHIWVLVLLCQEPLTLLQESGDRVGPCLCWFEQQSKVSSHLHLRTEASIVLRIFISQMRDSVEDVCLKTV